MINPNNLLFIFFVLLSSHFRSSEAEENETKEKTPFLRHFSEFFSSASQNSENHLQNFASTFGRLNLEAFANYVEEKDL
ncbi:MAG: hypothetical protein CMC13_12365 [Flavobacteriaceae bacterium]|nr:hypothetical protein [Flavobacteriaceae bacterium]